jgi:glycosyltransferase involved in cell wall biosynthesis
MNMPFANADLKVIEAKLGRPLRVLHLGNIANNAYNNARIQRQRGIDAYALSFDYYHIMATPEWEDADFTGDVGDPFHPDWSAVNLDGFKRPRWFVAGPLDLSIRYLLACLADTSSANWLWRILELERWLLSSRKRSASAARHMLRTLCPPGQVAVYNPAYSSVAGKAVELLEGVLRLAGRASPDGWRSASARLRRMADLSRPMHEASRTGLVRRHLQPALTALAAEGIADGHGGPVDPAFLDTRMRLWTHPLLGHLFSKFDVVQCYATYTAMPWMLGRRGGDGRTGYIAYEHGTIRSLPFEDSDEGRLCAASYRAAARVCVTNTDNLAAAERLGIAVQRVIPLPHAFDDLKLNRFAESAAVKAPPTYGRVTFFTPARQDWTKENPGYAKNNDRIFHALKILRDEGASPLLKAVSWGTDVDASKALIDQLGVTDMVEWVPTMKKKELWQAYLESHAVVDQFCSPALGGVSFETMALGRRLISHLDKQVNRQFFGEEPPILYAETAADIAAAMRRVLTDPQDVLGDGNAARLWMLRFHSADRITALQVAAYRDMTCGGAPYRPRSVTAGKA